MILPYNPWICRMNENRDYTNNKCKIGTSPSCFLLLVYQFLRPCITRDLLNEKRIISLLLQIKTQN